MTRPSGPAEPPGPSAGMEIAAHFKGRGLTPEEAADLARRIDAALAERPLVFECPACGLVKGRIHDLHLLDEKLAEREAQAQNWKNASDRSLHEAEAAREYWERAEAQIAALREALEAVKPDDVCYCTGRASGAGKNHEPECVQANKALTSTADAAARCLARARQEGAEEMRARAAGVCDDKGRTNALAATTCEPDTRSYTITSQRADEAYQCAAAIRALDAGAIAARKGEA